MYAKRNRLQEAQSRVSERLRLLARLVDVLIDARLCEGQRPNEKTMFEIAGVHVRFMRDVVKRLLPYLYQAHIKIGREWWSPNVIVHVRKVGGETPATLEIEDGLLRRRSQRK